MKKRMCFILIGLLAVLELGLIFLIQNPIFIPSPLTSSMVEIYMRYERKLIQLESHCARYDPEITYTLRPGHFSFSNSEFKNKFEVNQMGLRDDESSLIGPEIIVLGDSMAMGWGVEQNETYAQILETEGGLRSLNAAISSYGTARELLLLNRLDVSHLKYLVIHYMPNDYDENRSFYENKGLLPHQSEEQYKTIAKTYLRKKAYFPGKFTVIFFNICIKKLVTRLTSNILHTKLDKKNSNPMDRRAEFFLYALEHGPKVPIQEAKVIVLGDRTFIKSLSQAIQRGHHPDYIKKSILLSLNTILNTRNKYILDDHINAAGHRAIADKLLKVISR